MKQLICLATQGWCDIPSRTQHLLGRMRDTKILYFSPKGEHISQSGQRVRPNITVYTLPTPLFRPSVTAPPLVNFDRSRAGAFVAKMARKHNFHRPILWTTCPSHVHFLPHVDYSCLIYDCNQEWDDFPLEWEGKLANLADVVFVASCGLEERLSPCSENIAVIPNGVNFPLFSAQEPAVASQRPVLGWVGRISHDLNLSPLLFAARSRPNWRFLLVGEVEEPHSPQVDALLQLPNVKLHRRHPLAEVPSYLAPCHVLLDLSRGSCAGSDIVPRRIYEYLSTGLPIVSMILPDQVELFPDVIYAAHDDVEFLRMCDSALSEAPAFVRDRRRHYGEEASWVNRVAEMTQILDTTGFL